MIRYLVKGLNSGLQTITLFVGAFSKYFQEGIEFSKKAEEIRNQGEVKAKEKKAQTWG